MQLVHFLSREMVYLGSTMVKYFPDSLVDFFMVMLSKLVYGDLTKYAGPAQWYKPLMQPSKAPSEKKGP